MITVHIHQHDAHIQCECWKRGWCTRREKGLKIYRLQNNRRECTCRPTAVVSERIPFSKIKILYIYIMLYNRNLPIHTHTLYVKYIYIHGDERSKRHRMNTCWLTVYWLKIGRRITIFFLYDTYFFCGICLSRFLFCSAVGLKNTESYSNNCNSKQNV